MADPAWGAKRACPNCSARFYDLMRDPVPCPSCGSVFALEALSERKSAPSSRSRPKAQPVAAAAVVVASDDDAAVDLVDDGAEVEDEADEATDDVLLDDDDSDDDEGDLGEIGDVVAPSPEEPET